MVKTPAEQTLNIVSLINDNPLTKLSSDYGSKILEKIMKNFSPEEQNLYMTSLYTFLNCKPDDYNINLDDIWKMIGFGKKSDCKSLLVNNFVKDKHYVIMSYEEYNKTALNSQAASGALESIDNSSGYHNREVILITVYCFKKMCLKAKTKKSDEIHEYYIKLEEIINELVIEQAEELRIKLQNKDKELEDKDQQISTLQEAVDNTEDMIITNSEGANCVYLAVIEEDIINDIDTGAKFGHTTNRMKKRIAKHKKTFPKFELTYTINSDDHEKLERLIKYACEYDHDSPLYNRRYSQKYGDTNQTELIRLDKKFTIDKLYLEVIKLNEQCRKNLNAEIKQLREEIVILKNQLSGKTPIPKDVKIPEPLFQKCGFCGIKTTKENTDINLKTGIFFSMCNKDRATVSLRNEEIRKEDRDKEIYASEIRQNEWKKIEYTLLHDTTPVVCGGECKLSKLPTYFGVSKTTNRLYLKCLECRDLPFPVVYQDIPEGFQECGLTKCRNIFEKEFDDIRKKPYLTCPDHREKDLAYTDKKKKTFALQKTQENIPCSMKGCKNILEKDLNSKKDGYYQKCRPHRGIVENEEVEEE